MNVKYTTTDYWSFDLWSLGFGELKRDYNRGGRGGRVVCPLGEIFNILGKEVIDGSYQWVLRVEEGRRLYFRKIRAVTEEDKVSLPSISVEPGEIIYFC